MLNRIREKLRNPKLWKNDCLDLLWWRRKIFGLKVLVGEKRAIDRGDRANKRIAEQSQRI